MQNTVKKPQTIFQTDDLFIDSIQWSDNRAVLVHRREHGGRTYVRFRTWNRHKTKGVWYPSTRPSLCDWRAWISLLKELMGRR